MPSCRTFWIWRSFCESIPRRFHSFHPDVTFQLTLNLYYVPVGAGGTRNQRITSIYFHVDISRTQRLKQEGQATQELPTSATSVYVASSLIDWLVHWLILLALESMSYSYLFKYIIIGDTGMCLLQACWFYFWIETSMRFRCHERKRQSLQTCCQNYGVKTAIPCFF